MGNLPCCASDAVNCSNSLLLFTTKATACNLTVATGEYNKQVHIVLAVYQFLVYSELWVAMEGCSYIYIRLQSSRVADSLLMGLDEVHESVGGRIVGADRIA